MKLFSVLLFLIFTHSAHAQSWTDIPVRRVCTCERTDINYLVTLVVSYKNVRGDTLSRDELLTWRHSEWLSDLERAMRECQEELKVNSHCKSII